MTKPTLYVGQPLPLDELPPEEFAAFVHGAMEKLGRKLGIKIENITPEGGDGGFDSWSVRLSDNGRVCVQCKRSDVNLGTVASELAKVALTSIAEGTTVAEYYMICAGKTAQTIDPALRQQPRTKLIDASVKAGRAKQLKHLRSQVMAKGDDLDLAIQRFVENLGEQIKVWSGGTFQRKLVNISSEVCDLVAHHFQVHPVLRDSPWPDFDEDVHLGRLRRPVGVIEPSVRRASFPPNLRVSSAATPHPMPEPEPAGDAEIRSAIKVFQAVEPGECDILCAPGGAGKSTALAIVAAASAVARGEDDEKPIPVLVRLKDYRTSLDELVRQELGITWGHWRSLPGPFLLLLDGLNEVSPERARDIAADIGLMKRDAKIAFVIALRDVGLDQVIVLPEARCCWTLVPWTLTDIRRLASTILDPAVAENFVHAVLDRLGTAAGAFLFTRPFVVRYAAQAFSQNGYLPETVGGVVREVLDRRFHRNEEQSRRVSDGFLRRLAGEVSYALHFVKRTHSVSLEEIQRIVHHARAHLVDCQVFSASDVRDHDALDALVQYEYLTRSRADRYSFEHDIVSGFLAAPRLAATWRDHVETIEDLGAEDVWMFVGENVPMSDHLALIKEIAGRAPYLAARVAREAGLQPLLESELLAIEAAMLSSDGSTKQWMIAAAHLATPPLIDRLRKLRASASTDATRTDAMRALASAGDEETLTEARNYAERFPDRLHQMLRIDFPLRRAWESAPPAVALRLAPSHIENAGPNTSIGASAKTLKWYGSPNDGARLEQFAQRSESVDQIIYAWDALRVLDPQRARERACVVAEAITHAKDALERAEIYFVLAAEGNPVDVEWLVSIVEQGISKIAAKYELKAHKAHELHRLAADILERATLLPEHRIRLEGALPHSDAPGRILAIARAQGFEGFGQHSADGSCI